MIEAGARVFAELGFHAATKERIGAAAGFSHQTVRDYFRTKEALLTAIVADAWRVISDAMANRPGATPVDRLMSGYDALDRLARSRPAEARCVLHEAQIAGARGAPLQCEEEKEFKKLIEEIVAQAAGNRGASIVAHAEVVIASMEALARQTVLNTVDGKTPFSAEEARQSFRAIAEAIAGRAS